jgi:5'-phosphate synthase pdxT subunit
MRIGVLSFQGSVVEHERSLRKLGVEVVLVKTLETLNSVDGLIIPGGESTTIGKLLNIFGLFEPLQKRLQSGMPCYGTCAGMILLANEVAEEQGHLKVIDIKVRRNAYGRQIDSFKTTAVINEFAKKPLSLVFIRAPWIETVGPTVKVLFSLDGHIVAARNDSILVTSFHPELTSDSAVHSYFVKMVEQSVEKLGKI